MKYIRILLVLGVAAACQACTGDDHGAEGVKSTAAKPEMSEKLAPVPAKETAVLPAQKVAPPPTQKAAAAPVQLAFFDSRIFDEELSSSMSGGPSSITVDAPAGFTLNKIPKRFDRWLYSVKEGGGKVVAKPEDQLQMRGIVGAVIDVIVSIFEKVDEIRLYQPSEQYNATLLYRADGTVSKVLFERRYDKQ